MRISPNHDAIVDAFEAEWKSNRQPDLPAFLRKVPESLQVDLAKLLIPIDIDYRINRGDNVTASDYENIGSGFRSIAENAIESQFANLNGDTTQTLNRQDHSSKSQVIGNYKLLQKLGEGGMGTVWMAEQEKPVRRRVALKLIKAGHDSKEVVARFEAERQALAMMDHHNIAKVLDGGTTETGQPYFVMELVQGIPFNKYCDQHKLSINERLELFVPICNAVQHAHQKGIIHRDLKPSNILVSLYDGKPVPKVIDFGLAKALQHQSKLTDKTLFTEFGQVVGTLQYMSPEQAEMNQLDVDTRTDVYSLGVILYELLTGSTPIDADTLKNQAIFKVLESIRETEPPRPSVRLSSSTNEAVSGISQQRQIDPGKLKNILRGELDWIVMKALEKDRSRRYETASGFGEDVMRYVVGDVVNARPPSIGYQIRKGVRRNRSAVLVVSAVLMLLILGLAGTGSMWWRAEAVKQELISEANQRKSAEDRKSIAERNNEKLANDLTASSTKYSSTVAQLALMLDKDKRRNVALPLLQEAAKENLMQFGANHPSQIGITSALAELYSSLGDVSRAEALHLESVHALAQALGKEHPFYAKTLFKVGKYYESLGDLARAEALLIEAKAIQEKVLGTEHPMYAKSLVELADLYVLMDDHAKAETLYMSAISISEKVFGKEHPDYAAAVLRLAELEWRVGNFTGAEQHFVEAKAIQKEIFGSDHTIYQSTLNRLAGLYRSIGEYQCAEPLYIEAQNIAVKTYGRKHPEYANCLTLLAECYASMGEFSGAEVLFLEAKSIHELSIGLRQVPILNGLAALANSRQSFAEAQLLYERSVEVTKNSLGENHPDYAKSLTRLGEHLKSNADFAPAMAIFIEASAILEKTQGNGTLDYAKCQCSLADVMAKLGDGSRAQSHYEVAIEIVHSQLNETASLRTLDQQRALEKEFRYIVDNYLSFCAASNIISREAVEWKLLVKGSLSQRMRSLRQASFDQSLRPKHRLLQDLVSRYSRIVLQSHNGESAGDWRLQVESLRNQRDEIENELIRAVSRLGHAPKPVKLAELQRAIPEDCVLVDILWINGTKGEEYIASTISNKTIGKMVSLGGLDKELIHNWLRDFGRTVESQEAGRKIRDQIWAPLADSIHSSSTILLSIDGDLGRLDFGALPGATPDSFLIEQHRIVLIPVPQLLPSLMQSNDSRNIEISLLAVGGINYDLPNAGTNSDLSKSRVARWPHLSSTKTEADFIVELLQERPNFVGNKILNLQDTLASESAFRENAEKSRFIHLATHGFAGEPLKSTRPHQVNSVKIRGLDSRHYSGLVFAGANSQDQDFTSPVNDGSRYLLDDSMLTADEVAYMNLESCEMTVLSSCEGGIGAVDSGEGLLGLQRAFQLAGVRSVVSSLTKVEDDSTCTLMKEFYTNLFQHRKSKLDALRDAQLELLNHYEPSASTLHRGSDPVELKLIPKDRPSALRTGRLSPKYWATFQLSGDWR